VDDPDARRPALASRTLVRLRAWGGRFSYVGLIVGWLFLCLSMTPSLLPRGEVHQGILSGIAIAFGYGVGTALSAVWRYLELPEPPTTRKPLVRTVSYVALAVIQIWALRGLVTWQNNLRRIFGMEIVDDLLYPVVVLVVAALVGVALVGLGRLLARPVRRVAGWITRHVPRRVGRVLGFAIGVFLVVAAINGLVLDTLVDAAQSAFSVQNGTLAPDVDRPTSSLRSGSDESLVPWETMGQPGRKWVARGPTADDIDEFGAGRAMEPIRVYVGLDSAETMEERAALALDELVRTGAFDRDVLVLATSTGSGGIDPNATRALEYIHNGNTAIAGFQYSYLPSWISLLVDQEVAKQSATTFFETVHDHWRELDEDARPALYLFGVSLGSYGSEASATSIHTIGDPVNGSVWAGPTFVNDGWKSAEDDRDPGSPAWLPIFDEGALIRFTGNGDDLDLPEGPWNDGTRVVYIQHPSDPVSFFSFDLLFHPPEWLDDPRSPEMSPDMTWYPLVTFWQVAMDLPMGGGVPPGYGHSFGTPSFVAAWVGVTQPVGWTDADSERLIDWLAPIQP
jgi:uncharacterized membrane protein